MENKTYKLTKKIAKHGKQAIIVVPTILQDELPAGTIVQLEIAVLKEKTERRFE